MVDEEIAKRVTAIRDDTNRGAAELARKAVEPLGALATDQGIPDARFGELFLHTARSLGRVRPSMTPLLNGAGTLLTAWMEAGIEGVTVRNAYFDLTPGRYVTGYVTEDGLLNRRDVSERARHAQGSILL